MNERRELAIENVMEFLSKTREEYLLNVRGCSFECRSIMYGALAILSKDLLKSNPERPFSNWSYEFFARKIKAFKSPDWYDSPSRYSSYEHSCGDAGFAQIFRTVEDSLKGLELNQFSRL